MFFIDKRTNKIRLTKGDSAAMLVKAHDLNNEPYEFQSGDSIVMTVKNPSLPLAVLTLTADSDHYITFSPSDTSSLATGLYVYDIQMTTSDGRVYTIVPKTFFELTSEVSQ